MRTVLKFSEMKKKNELISVVTCYDHWSARIIDETNIDAVLVGDSAAMVIHGFETTLNADIDLMLYHIAAVRRGLTDKILIGDMPFLAHRKGKKYLMNCVDKYIKAGAEAVKIEGAGDEIDIIKYIVNSGVPVMGHIGLTPQSYHKTGGFKLQGVEEESSKKIFEQAIKLEEAGVFALVLEMIPATLAKTITEALTIPTIGIGAGPNTDGQVLVLQDLLGLTKNFNPKFLRKYLDGAGIIKNALEKYNADVKSNTFPSKDESY